MFQQGTMQFQVHMHALIRRHFGIKYLTRPIECILLYC